MVAPQHLHPLDRAHREAEVRTRALYSDWAYKILTRDEVQAARARDNLLAAIVAQHDAARALVAASGLPVRVTTPNRRPESRDEQRPNRARRAEGRDR